MHDEPGPCGYARVDVLQPVIAAGERGAFAAGLETAPLAIRIAAENAGFGAPERRGVGQTLEERLRIEAEHMLSMFLRKDSQAIGTRRVQAGREARSGRTAASRRKSAAWPVPPCRLA